MGPVIIYVVGGALLWKIWVKLLYIWSVGGPTWFEYSLEKLLGANNLRIMNNTYTTTKQQDTDNVLHIYSIVTSHRQAQPSSSSSRISPTLLNRIRVADT